MSKMPGLYTLDNKLIMAWDKLISIGGLSNRNIENAIFNLAHKDKNYDVFDTTLKLVVPSFCQFYSKEYSGLKHIEILEFEHGTQKLGKPGKDLFDHCVNLKKIIIPDTVTEIHTPIFSGCYCLEEFIVDENSSNFKSENGVLFNKDMTELIIAPSHFVCKNSTYIVPETVKKINDFAFYDSDLLVMYLPKNLSEVNYNVFPAFRNCLVHCPERILDSFSEDEDYVEFNKHLFRPYKTLDELLNDGCSMTDINEQLKEIQSAYKEI